MNVQIFQWIHTGAGTRPVMDGLAVLFGEGGPYLLAVLFAVLWFFAGQNKKTALLEAACGVPLLAVTVLTAWGRVYGGIHFPFDMAGSLVVGLGSVGLTRLVAKPLNPLNERLIRIVDQLTSRFVRTKKRKAREKLTGCTT